MIRNKVRKRVLSVQLTPETDAEEEQILTNSAAGHISSEWCTNIITFVAS